MRRADFTPDEQQDALFELQPEIQGFEDLQLNPDISIEELVLRVTKVRAHNIRVKQAQAGVTEPQVPTPIPATPLAGNNRSPQQPKAETKRAPSHKGGSFSTGLQRRLKQANTAEALARTTPKDLALVSPQSLVKQLSPFNDRHVYDGVLFTANEYKKITLSPRALAIRIGANVLGKEDGRSPSEANRRSAELEKQGLENRHRAVDIAIGGVQQDLSLATQLDTQMQIPRYAHMSAPKMDELLQAGEKIYFKMLKAIAQNHELDTERVESLTAALEYLLTDDQDVAKTQRYWRHLNEVSLNWSERKLERLTKVKQNVEAQLATATNK